MDLFEAINSLWTKAEIDKPPPRMMLHRFLVGIRGKPVFLQEIWKHAKQLNLEVWDDTFVYEIWKRALAKQKPPFYKYTGPGKQSEDDLVAEVAKRFALSRVDARCAVEIFTLTRQTQDLRAYVGLPVDAGSGKASKRTPKKATKSRRAR